jgi:hypothetical protein
MTRLSIIVLDESEDVVVGVKAHVGSTARVPFSHSHLFGAHVEAPSSKETQFWKDSKFRKLVAVGEGHDDES